MRYAALQSCSHPRCRSPDDQCIGRATADAHATTGAGLGIQFQPTDRTARQIKSQSFDIAEIGAELAGNALRQQTGAGQFDLQVPGNGIDGAEQIFGAGRGAFAAERASGFFECNDRTAGRIRGQNIFRAGLDTVTARNARVQLVGV